MARTKASPWYRRGHLVYVLALPLLPASLALFERGETLLGGLFAATLAGFVLASLLIRRGLRVQYGQAASRFATRYTHPLTFVGAALVGGLCFVTQWGLAGNSLALAGTLGGLGFAGAFLCYGAPSVRRVQRGGGGYTADEIATQLHAAESRINAIEAVARRLDHREARLRLLRVVVKSHRILNEIQEDPADLRRARKFFSVFVPGLHSVSESYLKVVDGDRPGELDERFIRILTKMEALVDQQHLRLQQADEFDLDVQIEVLGTQIDEEWDARKVASAG
jgi:hypothetical protein